jgi:hypothetical protein
MKKALLMLTVTLFPRILVAQELDLAALAGTDWYGLYLNGQKAGYATGTFDLTGGGGVHMSQESVFRISQAGVRQELRITEERIYAPDGALLRVVSEVRDPMGGDKHFRGELRDGRFFLTSTIGGSTRERELEPPAETLADALRIERLVQGTPKPGDSLTFSRFEPMFEKSVPGKSIIVSTEERVLDGVTSTLYTVRSEEEMGGNVIASETVIDESGTVLEGSLAGVLTMRLEPEDVAKDVNYTNDVIISNIVHPDKPVENPRGRESLRLRIRGPLADSHLLKDGRQTLVRDGDAFLFTATRESVDPALVPGLPVTNPDVAEWLLPSPMVQSDDPRLVAKASEIVGDTTNAWEAAVKLSRWVNTSMRSTYSASLSNALEVLDTLEGDCTEHSVLFVGLARAAGIPAREVAGLAYVTGSKPGFYFHQWAKVWVGRWVDMDPTFNQELVDVTHIKLAEGDLLQQAHLAPVVGRLEIEVLGEPTP